MQNDGTGSIILHKLSPNGLAAINSLLAAPRYYGSHQGLNWMKQVVSRVACCFARINYQPESVRPLEYNSISVAAALGMVYTVHSTSNLVAHCEYSEASLGIYPSCATPSEHMDVLWQFSDAVYSLNPVCNPGSPNGRSMLKPNIMLHLNLYLWSECPVGGTATFCWLRASWLAWRGKANELNEQDGLNRRIEEGCMGLELASDIQKVLSYLDGFRMGNSVPLKSCRGSWSPEISKTGIVQLKERSVVHVATRHFT
jgi:hypothetical protein